MDGRYPMSSTKYELVNYNERTGLYRIRALRDIPRLGITAGDLGGLVTGEHNLSQEGDSWICVDARVFGDAKVSGNAVVSGYARVFGNVEIYGNARVSGCVIVSDRARVFGEARVFGKARVSGDSWVYGDTYVFGNAEIYGDAKVSGEARVFGKDILTRLAMTINPGRHHITITDNHVNIGCEQYPMSVWLSPGFLEEKGKRHNYKNQDILFMRRILLAFCKE